MIITRSPLRITFGGGGTDLPSYYRRFGGFLISGAINKYVYINVMRPFKPGIFLKYSRLENVMSPDEIQHPIIREAIKAMNFPEHQIEITTLADIPAGTGLGSSGSFGTALIRALYSFDRRHIFPRELAEQACEIEIVKLGEPVGKQDQYIAALGGLTCLTFNPDDTVDVAPLRLSAESLIDLEENLLLFFTGFSRNAGQILKDQDTRTGHDDETMLKNLHEVKEMGQRAKVLLESGKLNDFGLLMSEQWEQKKRRSGGMSNPSIDEWYHQGLKNGALGGKLVGAGGGGFLLFYAEDHIRLRRSMVKAGLTEVRFDFDFEGAKVLFG